MAYIFFILQDGDIINIDVTVYLNVGSFHIHSHLLYLNLGTICKFLNY